MSMPPHLKKGEDKHSFWLHNMIRQITVKLKVELFSPIELYFAEQGRLIFFILDKNISILKDFKTKDFLNVQYKYLFPIYKWNKSKTITPVRGTIDCNLDILQGNLRCYDLIIVNIRYLTNFIQTRSVQWMRWFPDGVRRFSWSQITRDTSTIR